MLRQVRDIPIVTRVALLLCLVLAGCEASDVPAPDRPPHHTLDGFRNPEGSRVAQSTLLGDRLPFFGRMIGRAVNRPTPQLPPDHALTIEQALAGWRALDGRDGVLWLGHACFLVRLGGVTILTDPFLGEVAGPGGIGPRRYVPPGIPVDQLPPVDAVVVSHNHYDHLDAFTVEALPDKHRTVAVVPLGLGDFFRDRGYVNVAELDWHGATKVAGVTVTALPAIHFSRRGPFDLRKTLWMSYGLEANGRRIYHSGDTGYGPVFADEIGQRYPPFDLALVAIGAYEPQVIMRTHHVTPEEAVQLGRDIKARALVGMHWGTIVLTEEPILEPPLRFRAAGRAAGYPEAAIWVLKIGEARPAPWIAPRAAAAGEDVLRAISRHDGVSRVRK
jgi:N-acyl-phosphatidylethanolamine-hydrolysing phospholipase D